MWVPAYSQEDEWIVHRYELSSGNTLRFAAQDVRKQQTGIHAKVSISMNWVSLAWTTFNVERDEDRVRLANSAWKHLEGPEHELDRAEFIQNHFKHALDLFCSGLWEHHVGVDIGGLMQGNPDILPAQRALGDYILKEGGTILFAPPGSGKSYTMLAQAVSLMWGIDKIWPVYSAACPLYINVERSQASMEARLARVNAALGLDPRTAVPFLNKRGYSLTDIYEAAKKTIKQEGCTHVFYDSISRAGGGSLIKDDVANQVMDMLSALSPAWVALAHSPRQDESHVYGSQMFDAAADLTVQLKAQSPEGKWVTGIGLQIEKANDLPRTTMRTHVLEWDTSGAGLIGIRTANQGEFVDLEAEQGTSDERKIEEYLLRFGWRNLNQINKDCAIQPQRALDILKAGKQFLRRDANGTVEYSVVYDGDRTDSTTSRSSSSNE